METSQGKQSRSFHRRYKLLLNRKFAHKVGQTEIEERLRVSLINHPLSTAYLMILVEEIMLTNIIARKLVKQV